MFKYKVISSDDGYVQMTALWDNVMEKYILPSITFHKDTEEEFEWDAVSFIFEDLPEFLRRWKKRKLQEDDYDTFEELIPHLNDIYVAEIEEVINEAIKEGWK